ncbi:MAG: serine/threonine protein kinase [Pirellulaceae bacterium]|nr:serine/threonine protein kinase [Pirellulaceae bacterium]
MADGKLLAQSVNSFEAAWRSGTPPKIADFLAVTDSPNDQCRRSILHELICIDLEYRWRQDGRKRGARPWTLDNYASELRELGPVPAIAPTLIAEEFRVRHRFGDHPKVESFHGRFPGRRLELEPLLFQVLAELKEESHPAGSVQVPSRASGIALDAPVPYQDFVVQQMLGSGRMGKVYRAWQRSLQREVAIKFLRKSFLNDADAIERFVREARIIAQLRHPNILAVHGLGRTPYGGYFMVLDLVRGHDLATVAARQSIEMAQAVGWVVTAADALAHAHQRGIVHCDLKPANLLLDEGSRLLVADFGLARTWSTSGTLPYEVAGTAPFMAPEQIEPSFGSIGPWTDVYSLGAVLYSLLAGRPPYLGQTLADFLAQIVAARMPPGVDHFRPDLPREVADVCMRCLQKDPSIRFQDMRDLKRAAAPLL